MHCCMLRKRDIIVNCQVLYQTSGDQDGRGPSLHVIAGGASLNALERQYDRDGKVQHCELESLLSKKMVSPCYNYICF